MLAERKFLATTDMASQAQVVHRQLCAFTTLLIACYSSHQFTRNFQQIGMVENILYAGGVLAQAQTDRHHFEDMFLVLNSRAHVR